MTRSEILNKELRLRHIVLLLDGRHEEYKVFGRTDVDEAKDAELAKEAAKIEDLLLNNGYKECQLCNGEGIYRDWNEEGLLSSDPCTKCKGSGLVI